MNVRRLRRIKEYILAEPLRVNMDILILDRSTGEHLPENHRDRWPKCGTVACICGWENVLYSKGCKDGVEGSIERLDLPDNRLFLTYYWPFDLRDKLSNFTPGTMKYAKVVAEAIESYIASNGWEGIQ